VGSRLEVYSPLILERLKRDEILLPRTVRVAEYSKLAISTSIAH
jgi:hypothetical protein